MVTAGQMQMFNKPEPYEAQVLSKMYKQQYEYFMQPRKNGMGIAEGQLVDLFRSGPREQEQLGRDFVQLQYQMIDPATRQPCKTWRDIVDGRAHSACLRWVMWEDMVPNLFNTALVKSYCRLMM